jgi:bifunctional ADP-heptose synthase (sugar kinase/adenylyltransferase)
MISPAYQSLEPSDVARVLGAIEEVLTTSDALVLEDYNKGVLVAPVIERAMALAQALGRPIVVDPKFRNFFTYRGATVFKPNRRELESALGAAVNLDDAAWLWYRVMVRCVAFRRQRARYTMWLVPARLSPPIWRRH